MAVRRRWFTDPTQDMPPMEGMAPSRLAMAGLRRATTAPDLSGLGRISRELDYPDWLTPKGPEEMTLPQVEARAGAEEGLRGALMRSQTSSDEAMKRADEFQSMYMPEPGQGTVNGQKVPMAIRRFMKPITQPEADIEVARTRAAGDVGAAVARGRQLTPGQEFGMVNRLQTQWDTTQKPVQEMRRQVRLMESGLEQARRGNMNAGSQQILVTFQKILDPTSVVRESEYARSPEGLSWLNRLEGATQRISQGGAGVPVQELEQFTNAGKAMLSAMEGYNNPKREQMKRTAETFGLDPVLLFPEADTEDATVPSLPATPTSGLKIRSIRRVD